MKKFHFPLARVREWRENQVTVEEARLERIVTERAAIQERRDAIERERSAEEAAVLGGASTDSFSLQALGEYRTFATRRIAALDRERVGCESRLVEQRKRVIEAQRKVRLLEKLEERRRKEWTTAFTRELDEQAAESHRSRLYLQTR